MTIDNLFIQLENTILETMACIDRNAKGIAIAVDAEHHLLDLVTDGDIRRAILANLPLTATLQELLNHKAQTHKNPPITASDRMEDVDLLALMQKYTIRHLPLLNDAGQVVRLVTIENLLSAQAPELPVTAMIMAGGMGGRLRPLTDTLPKPMLPVGGKPIIEWVLRGLKQAGIRDYIITTFYKGDILTDYLGNGDKFGINIRYIHEEKLTGTAGSLVHDAVWNRTLLVMNSDILTNIDYKRLLAFHQEHHADMTVAMHRHEIKVPYATIDLNDARITGLVEKPTLPFFINAGIYVIEPTMRAFMRPDDEFLDMPDFIQRLLDGGQNVCGFPLKEYWLDIGQHAQYEQAQRDILTLGFSDDME